MQRRTILQIQMDWYLQEQHEDRILHDTQLRIPQQATTISIYGNLYMKLQRKLASAGGRVGMAIRSFENYINYNGAAKNDL